MSDHNNIRIRRSDERGFEDFGWTDNWMTFSFANYHDPEWTRFGPLRVIVENHIQPHEGFSSHPHEDMEILTYVSSGVLTHGDNMGNKEGIKAGQMQRLTAGTGIVHSEMNDHDEVEHNIQIWILPDQKGHTPGYQVKGFSKEQRTGTLQKYIGPDDTGAMHINQDAHIFAGILPEGADYQYSLKSGRGAWLQIVHGSVTINNDLTLNKGDGAGITDLEELDIRATDEAELILFDVAMDFQTPYRIN